MHATIIPESVRQQNLRRMFNPRSIAVVGASSDPAKAGSQALQALAAFPGRLVAVNPREQRIQGLPCYASLAELPETVDLAVLAIPAERCIKAAQDAAASGIGGIFIISGGFGESGLAGIKLQAQLSEICRTTGLRLLGPNTSGFVNPHAACIASFVPGVQKIPKGSVAVVAQSGGVNLSISFLLQRLGAGVSLAVGLGNAVDVGSADVLAMLAEDENTKSIALHLEGVPQGRELFDVLRSVTPRMPVVALVAGRSDIGEFAISHTGNIIGLHQRTVAALEQAGVVLVDSTEALAQAVAILSCRRLPPKQHNGVGLVTAQAGPGLLIADGLKVAGVNLPPLSAQSVQRLQSLLPPLTFVKNPVDTGRPGPTFGEVVRQVAADEGIDAVLVSALCEPAVLDPVEALRPTWLTSNKSVVFGTLGAAEDLEQPLQSLKHEGIPVVLSPERLVLAGTVLTADSRAQWRLRQSIASEPASTKIAAAARLSGPLDEHRAKDLFATYGIDSPRSILCTTREEAIGAFRTLKRPLAVKIAAADVTHKTEVNGVHLGISDEAQLHRALEALAAIPTATPGRVLIEEMAAPGVDLIIGGVRDPSWGPCVVVGLGGVLAEAVADSAVRLAPLNSLDVVDMLASLRGRKLLDGFRNLPVCDRAAIAAAAMSISTLLIEHPEIAEVEINPLRVNAHGAQALDGLVVLLEEQAPH